MHNSCQEKPKLEYYRSVFLKNLEMLWIVIFFSFIVISALLDYR